MKKIGFKNFRKFVDFPITEYGPITFLVGRNNSGKSTLVKALLLINNYFKSESSSFIDFGNLDDLNVATFGRIKNNTLKNDDSISFTIQIENFEINIQITANDENKRWARVIELCIKDLDQGYVFEIYKGGGAVTKYKSNIIKKVESPVDLFDEEILTIREKIEKLKGTKANKEFLNLTDRLNYLLDKKNSFFQQNSESGSDESVDYSLELGIVDDYKITNLDDLVIGSIENWYDLALEEKESKENGIKIDEDDLFFKDEKEVEPYLHGYNDRNNIKKSLKKFSLLIRTVFYDYKYISVSSTKQKSLFYIKDKSNPITDAINEYFNSGIELYPGNIAWNFTRKWMKEFEIGDDLKILQHAGEAYEFKIISNNIETPLADKGMGSVQAMLLILKMACIIKENELSEFSTYVSNFIITLIIEEPELNLHPALQSKLADLFLYVNQLFYKKEISSKIEFIIETHSEYLIRKTQLLVKENEFEIKPNENPFHVIYFDKDMKQWKMNYREDGKFVEEFGSGFYDESPTLTLKLF